MNKTPDSSEDRAMRFERMTAVGSIPTREIKTCSKCKISKTLDLFAWKNKSKGQKQSYCLDCQKIASKAHYQANKESYIKRNNKNYPDYVKWYKELKNNPCVDCGQVFHPAAMQWDHLPTFSKNDTISIMYRKGYGKNRILKEIEKCELVCANCHCIRTFNRLTNK